MKYIALCLLLSLPVCAGAETWMGYGETRFIDSDGISTLMGLVPNMLTGMLAQSGLDITATSKNGVAASVEGAILIFVVKQTSATELKVHVTYIAGSAEMAKVCEELTEQIDALRPDGK